MAVLIGYASQHGSTRSIATRIGIRLNERGSQIDVRPIDQVEDLSRYDAVVLGSALHDDAWLPEATHFVEHHRDWLAEAPLWMFSVGVAQVVESTWENAPEPANITRFRHRLRPMGHRLFAGALHREHLPLRKRVGFRASGGRFGDYREWAEVDAWAENIAHQLSVRH
jgi:menaquinone-dependent protoporphyrinogen oxidase